MIVNYQDFINSGLRVSDEILIETVEDVIYQAEIGVVLPILGDDNYIRLLEDPDDPVMEGGIIDEHTYMPSLKKAICYVAMAYLMRLDLSATTFGSVVKTDDYSQPGSDESIYNNADHYYNVGTAMLRTIAGHLGVTTRNNTIGFISNEFL